MEITNTANVTNRVPYQVPAWPPLPAAAPRERGQSPRGDGARSAQGGSGPERLTLLRSAWPTDGGNHVKTPVVLA